MIEINDLYKYYGERKAIGPLSFSIDAGEIVGLLGLNGAGKTTTLRILACDLLPSSGSVRVDGLDVVDRPHEVRSRIGYLPDVPPLYGEMTVREYLNFAARLRGLSAAEAQKRVPEVEEATEVSEARDQIIASLSHGFRQRVGIAQAIVHRPRLLVLDEPTSGLDPVQIVEMRELLRSLRGEHTILLSSHILSEISETCDRILVMRDGEIGAQGTEAELSAKLLRGQRAEVTVRGDAARAKEIAEKIPGVVAIDIVDAAEAGEGISTLQIESDRDVREALCRALVEGSIGLLGVQRGERELESVFLQLAADGSAAHPGTGKREKKRKAARAKAKASAEVSPQAGDQGTEGSET